MNDVSDRLFLGRIVPGMDVCDVTGEKVGSIALQAKGVLDQPT